ncbi:MAG: helix-turn-helix domain-containing protein [Actinomycetaceae bacterium]|nr:helix-turn-helix domain-containing protein [Actinomycetaceae bacterium]
MRKKKEGTKRQPGRPKADGTDRRQMILDVALSEFGTRGYEGASLARIAAGADITKAALLHYFQSKEALFAELLAIRDLENQKNVLRFNDPDKMSLEYLRQEGVTMEWLFDGDIWTYLDLVIQLAKNNEQNPSQVKLFITVSSHATNRSGTGYEWLYNHWKHSISAVADGFEKAKERGTVKPDLPSYRVARTLVAIMDGIQLQWAVALDRKTDEWMAKTLHEELADYVELLRARYEVTL